MKQTTVILSFLLLGPAVQAQTNYSKKDLAAIRKQRFAAEKAMENWDRPALYRTGLFFEGIYDRYKDTSISASIRLYTRAFQTEGDLHEGEAMKAARRLGAIFENGKGVPVDFEKAYTAYFMAGSEEPGIKRMKDRLCILDEVLLTDRGPQGVNELVIRFHPACSRFGDSTRAAIGRLANTMKAQPETRLHLRMRMPESELNHFLNYYSGLKTWTALSNPLLSYLVEVEGIATDRLVWDADPDRTGSTYQIHLRLKD